jgi:hypothetical protein
LSSPKLLAAIAAKEWANLARNNIPTQYLKQIEYEDMVMDNGRQFWAMDPPPMKAIYKYWVRR